MSAYAHTITPPANGVNGNHHVITFGGAVTDFIELIALAGAWTTDGQSGATISFGYALTSDVGEKAVFVFHGERGNNGKTTLLTLFRDLLGKDYSGQLVIDTVMSMKNQDATTRADLADLRGVRLVVTSEVEKEHRLSEGKIKYITARHGLDKILPQV